MYYRTSGLGAKEIDGIALGSHRVIFGNKKGRIFGIVFVFGSFV